MIAFSRNLAQIRYVLPARIERERMHEPKQFHLVTFKNPGPKPYECQR